MRRPSLQKLSDEAVKLIRSWEWDGLPTTPILKKLAVVIVGIRQHFDYDDLPDWRGRSYEYRMHMASIYEQANLPTPDENRIQSLLKYHTGNALREIAPPEDLDALGLEQASPKDRIQTVRRDHQLVAEQVQLVSRVQSSKTLNAERLFTSLERTVAAIGDRVQAIDDDEARAEIHSRLDHLRETLDAAVAALNGNGQRRAKRAKGA